MLWDLEEGSAAGGISGRAWSRAGRHVFVTVGDRGDRPSAQDVANENGSVVRLNRDGTVPPDNPLVGHAGARPEIWTWGHRNPQGAAFDADGRLWTSNTARAAATRSTASSGRELRLAGDQSYGRHYSGMRIGEGTETEGMAQPVHYWDPSIAPSGMAFIGTGGPRWRGRCFVGSLKFDISRG